MDPVQVVWFKRDLRLHDHAPLVQAARRGPVLPLYVVEPGLVRRPDYGPAHWTFVRASLRELRGGLAALGQPLLVRVGEVVAVLTALHEAVPFAALWAHEETGLAWTCARDRAVRAWARSRGLPFTELPQHGVARGQAAHQPTHAARSARWEAQLRGPALAPPAALRPVPGLAPGSLPTHQQLGLPPDERRAAQPGGEAAGLARRDAFLAGRAADAPPVSAAPATDACSHLGPHLAWGTVSLRATVLATRAVAKAADGRRQTAEGALPLLGLVSGDSLMLDSAADTADRRLPTTAFAPDLAAFVARLRWRCRCMQLLEDAGRIERESLVAPYDELRAVELAPLRGGPDAAERLAAWRAGRTGYPLIDASARALRGTGWLPSRLRALLVSFAADALWLPWQAFSDGLARLWLDYEPGVHLYQVQLHSGVTGGVVPRPADPTGAAREQDPTGQFIRHWVPELRHLPLAYLHRPWTLPPEEGARLGCVIGRDYPAPLIDREATHRAARAARRLFRRRPDVLAATAALRARRASGQDAGARQRARGQLPLW